MFMRQLNMDLAEFKDRRWIKKPDRPLLAKTVNLPGDSKGWLVIDSLGNGQAQGGIRLSDQTTLEEVQDLAAEMTLKLSFLGLPSGGAKSGIRCSIPLSKEEREKLFFSFGQAFKPLIAERVYLPGTDLGSYPDDIDCLRRGAGIAQEGQLNRLDSGIHTAVSVFSALQATCSHKGLALSDLHLGIQGLGKVGLPLLELAARHGLKVVAVSTRHGALYNGSGLQAQQLIASVEEQGDNLIPSDPGTRLIGSDAFFQQTMDVLCLCADSYPIHAGNVNEIKARIIVSGCNLAATPEMEQKLYHRGITYLPGFVCNSGGVLCHILSDHGFEEDEIKDIISRGIRRKLNSLLDHAKKIAESPATAALQIVAQNQERFAEESEARLRGSLSLALTRLRHGGIKEMIRTGLWPIVNVSLSRPPSFRRNVARDIFLARLFS